MIAPLLAAALTLTGPQVGSPAPDFHVTLTDGRAVSLADYHGRTLVVNVWGSWCPPCREETPDLIAAAKRLGGKGVAFLGVDTTETAPIVRAFVAAKGVPYPQAIGTDAFVKAYDVTAFPTTFVIDPNGVLRARFAGNLDLPTASAFVAAAQAGRDARIASEAQRQVDALLDSAKYPLAGDAATIRASAEAMQKAFDTIDGTDGVFDLLAAQKRENALRAAAVAALTPLATTPADQTLLARFRAQSAAAAEDWPAAIAAYRSAPLGDDPEVLDGLAFALAKTRDYAGAAAVYAREASLAPTAETWVQLADTQLKAGDATAGAQSYAKALEIARAAVAAQPGVATPQRRLAWTYIHEGRFFGKARRVADAQAAFDAGAREAAKLPKTDARYAMYLEQAQEERVALAFHPAQTGGKTALSLAPWTGPDLPGSIPSTLKYRLVVAGSPARSVTLTAAGLPKRWVASFCTDRVCAPFRTTVALPPSGVKVIEFQLVPPSPSAVAPSAVRVTGDGASVAVGTT